MLLAILLAIECLAYARRMYVSFNDFPGEPSKDLALW